MEDFIKITISVVIAIIYFIYQSNKNVQRQQTRRPSKMPTLDRPKKTEEPVKVSFEQLLKELEEKIQTKLPPAMPEESIEERKKGYKYKKEGKVSQPPKPFSYDDKYQSNVASKNPAVSQASEAIHSSQAPVNKKDSLPDGHPIINMLRNPDNLQTAFLMSEIFPRKW
ncbi:MAG: hypothetical protein RMJ87_11270 [Cytophagales bacterium]|nr:hypothetical protein [Bernardetiaceae bacterium]MDW8205599.1 hypothetical protein [Cytophagales bacterium]